jgi:hypothetical protein
MGDLGRTTHMAKYDELVERAKALNIPINSGVYKSRTEAWNELQITEYELHRRIGEEERHRREHRLWIITVISAAAALLSAAAAWMSVL